METSRQLNDGITIQEGLDDPVTSLPPSIDDGETFELAGEQQAGELQKDAIMEWYLHLAASDPTVETTKDSIREIHGSHRREVLSRSVKFLESQGKDLLDKFANGSEIHPGRIDPVVRPVIANSRDALLFRLASLWWSVPVSEGFGRRQRFLVLDRQNGKLIGIFALGDPVFNLSSRDKFVGWTAKQREVRLRYVVDAFVLGALPPYSQLLCGKLVAALVTSREVEELFCSKYAGQKTVIMKRKAECIFALLTTTSVFGKSCVYDRLRVNDRVRFVYVGETKGYGHFHIPSYVFKAMVELLALRKHPYARGNRFGMGPNWKMRVIRVALEMLQLDPNKLHHGLKRGVYLAPLASNFDKFLRAEDRSLSKGLQDDVDTISEHVKDRWIVPRSNRVDGWKTVDGKSLVRLAINSGLGREIL